VSFYASSQGYKQISAHPCVADAIGDIRKLEVCNSRSIFEKSKNSAPQNHTMGWYSTRHDGMFLA